LNIARALYKESDLFIFDDPLSALDQYVGKHIFENCFVKMLKNKTRIISSHQIQYSKYADYIYVLDDGKIIEEGTFEKLSFKQNGKLAELLNKVKIQEDDENIKNISELSIEKSSKTDKKHNLIEKEEKGEGNIEFSIIWEYLKSFGIFWFIGIIFYYIFTQFLSELPNVLISEWMVDPSQRYFQFSNSQFFIIYIILGYGSVLLVLFRDALYLNFAISASKRIHTKALKRILKATISFFEQNPIGRILNRFSKDVSEVDLDISLKSTEVITQIIQIFATLVIIMYTSLWFIIPMFPIFVCYYMIQNVYRDSNREVNRFFSISRSPLFAIYSETLNGLPTIRSYQSTDRFFNVVVEKLDYMQKNFYNMKALNMWLQFRLSILGGLLVSSIAFVLVFIYHFTRGNYFNVATAGLSMTYSIQITQILTSFVQKHVKLESEMNSIERLLFYANKIPIELENIEIEPKDWPKEGKIEFKNFYMKYRPELPNVLDDVSFIIQPKEKIGIAGRTGSGKSSLIISLFRIFQNTKGSIFIDDVDITKISLKSLRNVLAIIPQDPILFTGTIRSNLDPFDKFSEKEIWGALRKVFIHDFIEKQQKQLKFEIEEGGNNLSVGQRQLICLARCLLEKKKILIMDEATSSMDIETDSLIRK
jgi:ATP-binding cassette, subfamily C (CFTR/MRP), member 1